MKTINSLVLCMGLLISLCSRNVSTLCGTDDQIDDLKTALLVHESSFTIMTSLSAIPITGAALSAIQIISCTRFAMYLNSVFEEMKSSINKDHVDSEKCTEILDKTITATIVVKSTSVGLSIASMIPGVGVTLLPPRLASMVASILVIRDGLVNWEKNGCQYTTTRDCNL